MVFVLCDPLRLCGCLPGVAALFEEFYFIFLAESLELISRTTKRYSHKHTKLRLLISS
jgi:hypothetical protein